MDDIIEQLFRKVKSCKKEYILCGLISSTEMCNVSDTSKRKFFIQNNLTCLTLIYVDILSKELKAHTISDPLIGKSNQGRYRTSLESPIDEKEILRIFKDLNPLLFIVASKSNSEIAQYIINNNIDVLHVNFGNSEFHHLNLPYLDTTDIKYYLSQDLNIESSKLANLINEFDLRDKVYTSIDDRIRIKGNSGLF